MDSLEEKREKLKQPTTANKQLVFAQWVDKYSDYLRSHAMFKVNKSEDAEDLVQETFISAFKSYENYRQDASPRSWLTTILRNKIIDFYRKKGNQTETSTYVSRTEEGFNEEHFHQNNHGRWKDDIAPNYISNSTDEYVQGKEFQHNLRLCLAKLPSRLKNVFISKYIDAKTGKEICKEFGITSSNYWSIVFRSKTLLRRCLEKRGIGL